MISKSNEFSQLRIQSRAFFCSVVYNFVLDECTHVRKLKSLKTIHSEETHWRNGEIFIDVYSSMDLKCAAVNVDGI